jgi:hypothetical protein
MERGGEVMGQPKSGRIAVKVINHLGDEVMKMRVAVIICFDEVAIVWARLWRTSIVI